MNRLYLFFFLILIGNPIFCQPNYLDSLEKSLSSLTVAEQLKIIIAIPYDKIVANTTKAETLYLRSLNQAKRIKNQEYIADIYSQLSIINYFLGNYEKRLDFKLKAIKIYEGSNNISKAGMAYADLGFSMKDGNIEKAKFYMQKGIHLLEGEKDNKALNPVYDNYGVVQQFAGNIDSAIFYFNLALDLKRDQNDSVGIPFALTHLSGAYLIKQDYKKAKKYLDESYSIRKKRQDIYGTAESLVYYGDYYYAQESYKEALIFFNDGYILGIKNKYIHLAQYAAEFSAICYEKVGDMSNTIKFLKIQQALKDSLLNETTNKQIAEMETKYDTEKKQLEIKIQRAEIAEKDLDLSKSKNRILMLLFLSVAFLLVIGFVIINLRQKNKANKVIAHQKEIVELQNKEILSSINYAKRIQTAILPTNKMVKKHLKDSFILYKPKDIVAGDFYWMEHKEGKTLVAAADCTGHGVPGAMVSVVCNNALNRAVREYGLTDPGKILDKTREIVIQEFEKSEEDVKDGMDIALCSLEGKTLKYAGAHNPLWIIRNGELIETKANKQPIGKFDNLEVYTTHLFELQKHDLIYIFSDGFVDQFGGEKGKKYKAIGFRKLLLSIKDKPMEEQKILINASFEAWRGEMDQVDDVCIIGVRV